MKRTIYGGIKTHKINEGRVENWDVFASGSCVATFKQSSNAEFLLIDSDNWGINFLTIDDIKDMYSELGEESNFNEFRIPVGDMVELTPGTILLRFR